MLHIFSGARRGGAALPRDLASAARLRADLKRNVVAGHSMGGWVAAMTAEREPDLAGAIFIFAANMGGRAGPRTEAVATIAGQSAGLDRQLVPSTDYPVSTFNSSGPSFLPLPAGEREKEAGRSNVDTV